MATIRDWLKAHPGQAQAVMELDRSFVFFQDAPLGDPALGPRGSLGVPLTPLASLAVDTRLIPWAPPFMSRQRGPIPSPPSLWPSTGGAIRGPARGDIFFGQGAEAQRRAGPMKAPGRLFVLLPKPVAARLGADKLLRHEPAQNHRRGAGAVPRSD